MFNPNQECTGDKLRNINKLAKSKIPKGNPTMPDNMKEAKAKAIRRLGIDKSEHVTGSEDEPFSLDDIKDDKKDYKDTANGEGDREGEEELNHGSFEGDTTAEGAEGGEGARA